MQITRTHLVAESIIDVVLWVEIIGHHVVSVYGVATGMQFGTPSAWLPETCIRIPMELYESVEGYIQLRRMSYDTRHFKATDKGRELLHDGGHNTFLASCYNGEYVDVYGHLVKTGLMTADNLAIVNPERRAGAR